MSKLDESVRLTSLQVDKYELDKACSASARTRIRQRILIRQKKLIQKKVQTAQRKKLILNPNDPVQIRVQ